MELETYAKETAGNWKKEKDFSWFGQPDVVFIDDVGLICVLHRDSDLIQKSNYCVIKGKLEDHIGALEEGQDVEIHTFNHWAVGWTENFAIRVHRHGVITEAFKKLFELMKEIKDECYLDYDMYREMLEGELVMYIQSFSHQYDQDDANFGASIHEYLVEKYDDYIEKAENNQFPTDEQITEACNHIYQHI